jgi:hypothetical protein
VEQLRLDNRDTVQHHVELLVWKVERELLSAIRDSGGAITPAEAAMGTSLTVKEADRMLSELVGGRQLSV